MSSSTKSAALTKLNGMKITIFNAIAELENRSAAARAAGDNVLSVALAREAVALSRQSVTIREAEDKIRRSSPLLTAITKLNGIASDARTTLNALRNAAEGLAEAASLLRIVAKVATVFA